jgi:hypothetical protein
MTSLPHGLLAKAYVPTICLFAAITADVSLGLTVWHYSTWFNGLSVFVVLALIEFVAVVSIAQPTSGEG